MPTHFPSCRSVLATAAGLLGLASSVLWAEPPPSAATPADSATASPVPAPTPDIFNPWLGNPGVDPAAARARGDARHTAALRQQADAKIAVYDRAGKKDPRWDNDVRECLLQDELSRSANRYEAYRAFFAYEAACARALKAGCDDPLILYHSLRRSISAKRVDTSPADLARLYTRNEAAIAATDYPPLVKFHSALRTVEKVLLTRKAKQGWVGAVRYRHDEAAGWADGTDIKTAYQHATAALKTLFADPTAPTDGWAIEFDLYLDLAGCDAFGESEAFVPLRAFFESEAVQIHPTYATKLAEGLFWNHYAWEARGGGYAGTVTDEGWRDFESRQEKAAAAFEAAWKIDPDDPAVPRNMVAVAGSGPGDIDEWFRRAMDASPNDSRAADNRLNYLQSKWGGSDEAMLAFGRHCAATRDWTSNLPNVLLGAHRYIARALPENERAAYWKRPEVWAELKSLFTQEFKDIKEDWPPGRFTFAWYAYRAEDWQTADEQFKLLGDHPPQAILDREKVSLRLYQDTAAEAAKHRAEAAAKGN